MAVIFNRDQQQVIECRDRNILVSAAAGSGKTTVLVERIIRLINDPVKPVDIDHLLILTFTNAAAGEMRDRIGKAIMEQLKKDPLNQHLQRQETLIHHAQITTIHSFCLFLLKNHFNEIGLDPVFRVADEGELKLIRESVMNETVEELFENDAECTGQLADRFATGNSMKGLTQMLESVYGYSMSAPFPEDWLKERKLDYQSKSMEELEQTEWIKMICTRCNNSVFEAQKILTTCMELAHSMSGPYMYEKMLAADLLQLERAEECESFEQWSAFFGALTFSALSPKKDENVDPQIREQVKEARTLAKGILLETRDYFFKLTPWQQLVHMQETDKILKNLIDAVLLYKKHFDDKKRELKLIDFSDMEHLALSILLTKENGEYVPTHTALEYQNYFKEIMIDEYQDTNLVQEWIIKAVSGEQQGIHNRFMVGDVKQSIYRFRMARPELFMEKYATYERQGKENCRISLSNNYRSRKEIIQSVNDLFYKIMGKDLGKITYDAESALYEGASYENGDMDPTTELLLIERTAQDESKQMQEAEGIARRIKELLRTYMVTDAETKKLRPVKYRDIVILLRTNAGWDEEFKKAFDQEGIPAFIESKTGYFATQEIRMLLNFLKVLNNPKQDIPLFGVMKSDFADFSEDDLALLKGTYGQNHENLYECLQACVLKEPESNDTDKEKLYIKSCHFMEFLERYRNQLTYEPIHVIIQKFLDETGFLLEALALPGGEQRAANINMLLRKAESFEKTSYRGVFQFIRYMEQIQKYEIDYGEAGLVNENADVVRIMSIHKSKGLEFPICFVAGLSKRFNMQDVRTTAVFDSDLGIGMEYVNEIKRIRMQDLRRNLIAEKTEEDSIGEELRVLYVAMTRAKEKLILTGVTNDLQKLGEKAVYLDQMNQLLYREEVSGCMPYLLRRKVSCFMDWILLAVLYQKSFVEALEPYGYTTEHAIDIRINCNVTVLTLEKQTRTDFMNVEMIREKRDTLLEKMQSDRLQDKQQTLDIPGLAFSYEHQNLTKLFAKTTVSELKMAAMEEKCKTHEEIEPAVKIFDHQEKEQVIPRFVGKEEKVSGSARGSAYHRVMELLDLQAAIKSEIEGSGKNNQLQEQMEQWVSEGRLQPEEEKMVDKKKILNFLRQPLAKQMALAQTHGLLFREQPFVLGVPANTLQKEFPKDETVLVQGIIDAYMIIDQKIVLMDYKTDVVEKSEELQMRYQTQLDYYAEALTRITGLEVKEKWLYSFYLNQELKLL